MSRVVNASSIKRVNRPVVYHGHMRTKRQRRHDALVETIMAEERKYTGGPYKQVYGQLRALIA